MLRTALSINELSMLNSYHLHVSLFSSQASSGRWDACRCAGDSSSISDPTFGEFIKGKLLSCKEETERAKRLAR